MRFASIFPRRSGVQILFDQINLTKRNGLRDYAMLTLLYTTGIRVSELVNLRVRDVSLQSPTTLLVHGKGQKYRYVPLFNNAIKVLDDYITGFHLDREHRLNDWLFKNHM
jgi:integrase/recombinase XerD